MPIRVQCNQCGKSFGAKDEWAGKQTKCPNCGQTLTVATASSAPARGANASRSEPAAPQGGPLDLLGGEPWLSADPLAVAPALGNPPKLGGGAPRPPNNAKSKTLWIVLAVTSGVLLLSCGGCVVLLLPAIQAGRKAAHEAVEAQAARDAQLRARPAMVPASPMTPGAPGAAPVQGAVAPTAPAAPAPWTADTELVKQLGPELKIDRYAWRLPASYKGSPAPALPAAPGRRAQAWAWLGPAQLTGQQLGAMVIVLDFEQPLVRVPGDVEKACSEALKQFTLNGQPVAVSHQPIESGMLDGKSCVRTFISGANGGVTFHGIQYMFVEGQRMVSFNILSPETPGSAGFKLLESAALTFHEFRAAEAPAPVAAPQGSDPPG